MASYTLLRPKVGHGWHMTNAVKVYSRVWACWRPRTGFQGSEGAQIKRSQSHLIGQSTIGANNGITDGRQKVLPYLRHTFASWLVQQGVPCILYRNSWVSHYSDDWEICTPAPDTLKTAVKDFEINWTIENQSLFHWNNNSVSGDRKGFRTKRGPCHLPPRIVRGSLHLIGV